MIREETVMTNDMPFSEAKRSGLSAGKIAMVLAMGLAVVAFSTSIWVSLSHCRG